MRHAWTEVNITPVSQGQPEALLLSVIDPLVRGKLADRIKAWFYFWEDDIAGSPVDEHLRLRILWRRPARSALAAFLDGAREVAAWHEGNHGVASETYQGEAERYGAGAWEATYRDWASGSELALTLIKLESAGMLTGDRSFHWKRRAHLFANQLLLDDDGKPVTPASDGEA